MRYEMKDVSFSYDGESTIIKDISLVIEKPGLYCIVGPNGVGKSTLIKCMNRILSPTSGDITIDGKSISDMDLKEISSRIAYVPVTSEECFSMPVMDAILLGRYNKSKWRTSEKDIEMADRAMEMMGIRELSMRNYTELSAGQHQKVNLARGIVQETEMLLLDEPTANLDVKHQIYVSELLRALAVQENMIVVMISHDLNIAAKYSHEVIVMSKPGVIYSKGTPEEVFNEKTIMDVYDIGCTISSDQGRPHMMWGSIKTLW